MLRAAVCANGFVTKALVVILALTLGGCASIPKGKERVALVDELVARQEFKKIQRVLRDIDVEDPEFEALVIRRRAMRPLIHQFEQYTLAQVRALQVSDQWPRALALLREAQTKLDDSDVLAAAEIAFFEARDARLEAIQQQIDLLEGENQFNKTPLVEKVVAIHPTGIKTRWQQFRHERKNSELAQDLLNCGNQALDNQQLDLAEACFAMVKVLAVGEDVSLQLAAIAKERQRLVDQADAIAAAKVREQQQQVEHQIWELKEQYRHLAAAQWLTAAKQTLVQLRLLSPDDQEAKQWALALQAQIDHQVAEGIRKGQALYSHGKLQEALGTWQDAAHLDPENPILQGHIARAERFIQKLERLNQDKS